jgi:hypothetical protein
MEYPGIVELSSVEMLAIDGGKPFGFYVGFVLGAITGTTISFLAGLGGGLNGQHI